VVVMLPQAAYLRLDGDGFEIASMFKRARTPWSDTTGFEVAALPPAGHKMVVFDEGRAAGGMVAAANAAITGRTSALPDTFGLAPEELAQLMQQWRERALARR
jgi:hypothetical protein